MLALTILGFTAPSVAATEIASNPGAVASQAAAVVESSLPKASLPSRIEAPTAQDVTSVVAQRRAVVEQAASGLADRVAPVADPALGLLSEARKAPESLPSTRAHAQPASPEAPLDASLAMAAGAAVVASPLVSAALVGGATASSGAIDYRDARRGFLAAPMPFYSRLSRRELLVHDARSKLHETIRAEPGASLQDLVDRTGLSRSAVAYHLHLLERQGFVASERSGRARRYFPAGAFGGDVKAAVGAVRNPKALAIGAFIRDHPDVPQRALCAQFLMSPTAAHWHLRKLEEAGLVQSERVGKEVRYRATALWGALPNQASAVDAPVPTTLEVSERAVGA
ncbi:MAG TPA: MarR family transcriptional regulator [Candidatus Thermoplasmatota archaeon]|nr:MarR family transcriptional regulator [Candidatus Thermoplasmatota archaeon]